MKRLILITALLFIVSCQQGSKMDPNINPFFQEWNTAYEVPPFLDIKDEHYMPAYEQGMKENLDLTKEKTKLLNDTRKGFVRSGALLSEDQKERISEINSKISGLSTSFGQNLLAETNGFELILEASDLEGLSDGVIAAAADAASQKIDSAESEEE